MPEGTPVERMYRKILNDKLLAGEDRLKAEESAARIAQAQTGLALATGKPPKHGKKSKT